MGLFNFLERKLVFGEVITDYGVIDEYTHGLQSVRISALLCRRKGTLRLVLHEPDEQRHAVRSPAALPSCSGSPELRRES